MTKSRPRFEPIAKRQRQSLRLLLSVSSLAGRGKTARWLVLPDAMVLIRGLDGHQESPNVDFLEAIALGVVQCVMSEAMREEVTGVLGRPLFGSKSKAEVDRLLGHIWRATTWIGMAEEQPSYAKLVRDRGDVHIIRTAAGVFAHQDLNAAPRKFIVSADRKAFPSSRMPFGFECASASRFMPMLRDALE